MLSTSADWSESRYEEAVSTWLSAPGQADHCYREVVFPLACQRMRRLREGTEPLDLLFVPVGTQPYAPILAVLANPARVVALLETAESHPHGLEVEQALELETTFLHVRVSPTDVTDIAGQIRAVYETQGLPAAVGADVTGGTKPMTATVAGVGSLFGWRLFYLEGAHVRERSGLAHHERVLELPGLLDVFGSRLRFNAQALLKAGACRAAAEELRTLIRQSGASEADRQRLRLAEMGAALRDGSVRRVARLAPSVAMSLGSPLPPRTRTLLRQIGEGSWPAQGAILYCGARARLHEGDSHGARGLAEEALASFGCSASGLEGLSARAVLRSLRGLTEMAPLLAALPPLDRLVGRGLGDTVERLFQ